MGVTNTQSILQVQVRACGGDRVVESTTQPEVIVIFF